MYEFVKILKADVEHIEKKMLEVPDSNVKDKNYLRGQLVALKQVIEDLSAY